MLKIFRSEFGTGWVELPSLRPNSHCVMLLLIIYILLASLSPALSLGHYNFGFMPPIQEGPVFLLVLYMYIQDTKICMKKAFTTKEQPLNRKQQSQVKKKKELAHILKKLYVSPTLVVNSHSYFFGLELAHILKKLILVK